MLALLLAGLSMLAACHDSSAALSPTEKGGGPLIYWNQDLRRYPDDSGRFAAAVVGLSDVEVLQKDGNHWSAMVVGGPSDCKTSFPVALDVSDLDGSGSADVAVVDPACGNWIEHESSSQSAETVPWDQLLAPIAPQPFLDHFGGPSGYELVLSASNRSAQLSVVQSEMGLVASIEMPLPTPWLGSGVTDLAAEWNESAPAGEFQLVVQGEAFLYKLTVDTSGAVVMTNRYEPRFDPPYVAAFSAFDHLTSLRASGCPKPELWGSGVFPQAAHVTKRGLQQILLDENEYSWADIDVSVDVTTFAVVERPERGDVLLAVVGTRSGKDWLEVWRHVDCERNEKLLEHGIDFDWRTAPWITDGHSEPLPKSQGVKLLASWSEETAELAVVHYDGYDVRETLVIDPEGAANVSIAKDTIHASRDDLASE